MAELGVWGLGASGVGVPAHWFQGPEDQNSDYALEHQREDQADP
jgi:hypothetical protein